eukprot:TRINITY_DN9820_c0_g1_i1.p1 TRINITY_DN9820_c0_g1~~TRINITY_DN9820_c0_g1_i1.p1  ORF type:complete len:315 (-),score=66.55 TRINITY_DN9820_c0_g1_i1:529-1473(-)
MVMVGTIASASIGSCSKVPLSNRCFMPCCSSIGDSSNNAVSFGSSSSVNLSIFLQLRPSALSLCVTGTPRRALPLSSAVICSVAVASDVPTVAETKSTFLKAYKKPIPSIYNNFIQELLVQQHLMRYKRTYQYDPVFALGFVTVFNQLMDGYPSDEDREAIFKAYINALKEDPIQYRSDAKMLEEWASVQDANTIVEFHSRDGEVEGKLKDISERAKTKKNFNYSRFFAIGLFRLLELANATDPTVLEKLCAALNISKPSVDRDLDTYRNILSKLVQSKELLKEYVEREKKKRAERESSQKPSEPVAKMEIGLL